MATATRKGSRRVNIFRAFPEGDIAIEDLTIILEGFHGRKLQHVTSATYLVEGLTHAKTRFGG